jgi:hypothetical protein
LELLKGDALPKGGNLRSELISHLSNRGMKFMKFIDLATQQKRIRQQIENNISRIFDHG